MIVDYLIKIIFYKFVKVRIYILDLVKVIIDIIVYYHGISKFIIINQG